MVNDDYPIKHNQDQQRQQTTQICCYNKSWQHNLCTFINVMNRCPSKANLYVLEK